MGGQAVPTRGDTPPLCRGSKAEQPLAQQRDGHAHFAHRRRVRRRRLDVKEAPVERMARRRVIARERGQEDSPAAHRGLGLVAATASDEQAPVAQLVAERSPYKRPW